MPIRIKICGLTRSEDVHAAAAAGADALGFNFVPSSARALTLDRARELVAAVPPFVTTVALFVDASAERVREVVHAIAPDVLQFHGDENDDFCASFGRPYMKALRVAGPVDGAAIAQRYPRATGVLLDAAVAGRHGGTGQRFDWDWFPRTSEKPWVLAGGLDADNVSEAIARTLPYAVDVSSGVECAPGVKDAGRIGAFCRAARAAAGMRASA